MQHKVRFYFPFHFAPDHKAKLDNYYSQLKAFSLRSLQQRMDASESTSGGLDESVWEASHRKVDPRFNPHMEQLLNGRDTAQNHAFFGLQALQLSTNGRHFVNGGSVGDPGKGLRTQLSKAAIQRLAQKDISAPYDDNRWPITVVDAWLYHFNTCIGVMTLDIEYAEPGKHKKNQLQDIQAVAEMNYQLYRNSGNKQTATLNWVDRELSLNGLRDIVLNLNPWLSDSNVVHPLDNWRSVYTYSAVQSDQPLTPKEVEEHSFRLARHYTDAYLPSSESVNVGLSRPFDSLCHYHSLEGACSLIITNDGSPALDNFIASAINQAYEPITLIAYSEYLFLHQLSQGANITVDMRNPSEKDFAQLRDYRAKLYNFRLNNRFSHVGQLTQHNDYYRAMKLALGSTELLEDISTDVSEIEDFIADHIAEKNRQSIANIKVLGSMFAALVLLADLSGISIHQALTDDTLSLTAKVIFWSLAIGIPLAFIVLSKWLRNNLE